jgi:two-component system, cell cycle sensor histidine kinase and response regulator CckA
MAKHDPIGVLIVEDNADHADLLRLQLAQSGDDFGRVETAEDLGGAVRLLSRHPFDLVLLDLNLPDSRGIDTVARICAQAPLAAVVVTTAQVDESLGIEAIQHGAQDYLIKGVRPPADLRLALVHAVERQKTRVATAHLAAIVDESDDAILSATMDGTILTWNRGAERISGYPAAEVLGRSIRIVFAPERCPELGLFVESLRRGETIRSLDAVAIRKDGTQVDVSVTASPIHVAQGAATLSPAAAIVARDIGERKRAERALRASEEQYRLLFDNNPQPMWVYDGDTLRFVAVNDAAVRHYGYSRPEFLAMTLRDIRPVDELDTFEERLGRRRSESARTPFDRLGVGKHRRKDGSIIDVEISVNPIRFQDHDGWLALAIDITEKKRLEAQLLHAQKMESIGRLAAGIAHDFNNLLGVITGFAELARRQLAPGDRVVGRLDEILKAAAKAADLTRQLLAFSRRQVLELRVVDLNVVMADMEQILRRLIGEHIHLVSVYADHLGRIRADPGQIGQVIVNLAVNARDSMADGGRLIIETANVDLDEEYAAGRPDVKPGRYVMLAITDTGIGMNRETLARIFEPFFTTKDPGHGTGLGLATVYGIVKQVGGHIWPYSEPGKGTSFRMYFPRIDEAADRREPKPEIVSSGRGTETILVVEDDEGLRSIIAEVLAESGYSVLTARNGAEAVLVVERRGGAIDLVVSDMVMPAMGGAMLAEQLGDLRFLFMSGYSELASGEEGITRGVGFLQKPFTPGSLLRKVREALDGERE